MFLRQTLDSVCCEKGQSGPTPGRGSFEERPREKQELSLGPPTLPSFGTEGARGERALLHPALACQARKLHKACFFGGHLQELWFESIHFCCFLAPPLGKIRNLMLSVEKASPASRKPL